MQTFCATIFDRCTAHDHLFDGLESQKDKQLVNVATARMQVVSNLLMLFKDRGLRLGTGSA